MLLRYQHDLNTINMNDQVFEVLNNSSDDDLTNIVANKNNEFNNDTVNYARQILEDRQIDLADIPVENTAVHLPRGGDEEIKTFKFKSVAHIIFGPILFLGGVVLLGMSPES